MNTSELKTVWDDLTTSEGTTGSPSGILFRSLGKSAKGIRAAYAPQDQQFQLFIEVADDWDPSGTLPQWRGMSYEIVRQEFRSGQNYEHLCLKLRDASSEEVFLLFCSDLVTTLEDISDSTERTRRVEACIYRWENFFKLAGPEGLSPRYQQGLLAELNWLQWIMESGLEPGAAISAWRGATRGFYDFDMDGDAVEVKSTMSKEPRRVTISNERQLDDRGLQSLHLQVLTLQETGDRTLTLPSIVQKIREELASCPSAGTNYEKKLISAGYHAIHDRYYARGYLIHASELFKVGDGFPRIIDMPDGTGDLKYSLLISSCSAFLIEPETYLQQLKDSANG